MRILNHLGGIELPDAYTCIKAISKKKLKMIAKFREQFIAGATAKGLDQRHRPVELFGMIEKFAGYGFNKCHSHRLRPDRLHDGLSEGPLPASSSWPPCSPGDIHGPQLQEERLAGRASGRLPTDGHRSRAAGRQPLGGRLHRGRREDPLRLCAPSRVAGPRQPPRSSPPAQAKGPFRSLFDFCERVDPSQVNRATIETLIKAGASIRSGAPLRNSTAVLDRAVQSALPLHADRKSRARRACSTPTPMNRTQSPTATFEVCPIVPEWDPRRSALQRKGSAGLLSHQPSAGRARANAQDYCSHTTTDVPRCLHRTRSYGWRHALGDQVLADQKPAERQHAHQVRHVRPGGHATARSAASSGPRNSPNSATWSRPMRSSWSAARSIGDPAARKRTLIVNELIPLADLAGRFTKGIMIRLSEAHMGSGAGRPARNPSRLPWPVPIAARRLHGRWKQGLSEQRYDAHRTRSRDALPRRRATRPR